MRVRHCQIGSLIYPMESLTIVNFLILAFISRLNMFFSCPSSDFLNFKIVKFDFLSYVLLCVSFKTID